MRYGTIISYFPDKKFGFIKPDLGEDIFFHISAVDNASTQPEIIVGQAVKYELTTRREALEEARSAAEKKGSSDRNVPIQQKAKLVALLDKLPGGTLADSGTMERPTRHSRARMKKPTWRR